VRVYDKGFLHAKCWLFYADKPGEPSLCDRFCPFMAIVGSSNFTGPGLTSNRELNLAHTVLLDDSQVNDPQAQSAVRWVADVEGVENINAGRRRLIKSEVGARAIFELECWYEAQWNESPDFKETPISNELFDLYNQLNLITQGDRSYFSNCGIGDLHRYFLAARRQSREGGMFALFNLLEEIVIRRTRPFIRKAYPDATIRGEKIRFPDRELKTINYNLEKTYEGIYDKVSAALTALHWRLIALRNTRRRRNCAFHNPGPKRTMPGRKGMLYTEEDWVDEDATSHRSTYD